MREVILYIYTFAGTLYLKQQKMNGIYLCNGKHLDCLSFQTAALPPTY